MKAFLAICSLLAVASAASLSSDAEAPIISQSSDISPDGTYHSSYETGNGISAQESGVMKNPETEEVSGSYKYTAPDGTLIDLTYVANEEGFQPSGNILPVGPEIPAYIARALEWNAAHPEPEDRLIKH